MKICMSCSGRFRSDDDWTCPFCDTKPPSMEGYYSFLLEGPGDRGAFDSGYFPDLYRLEKGHFWFNHRTNLILGAIKSYLPHAKNLLEIGCGTGIVLSSMGQVLPECTLSGSDLFIEALRFAGMRVKGASLYQMDACAMPFEEEFDVVLALDILEHIDDDMTALRNMHRSLKKGGCIIVTVPQHAWLWSRQDEAAFHKRRYARKELVRKMEDTGFRVLHHTSFITILLPVMMVSRVTGGLMPGGNDRYDPMRELRISPVWNRIFAALCKVEERLIAKGTSLPAGGSLLCMGRKG